MLDSNQTLGKYRILEELGHGGFATVYRAEDTSLDRSVALKVLNASFTHDPALISRFQQEAKVTAKLFHPNIAALFEVGQAEGRYFLAMQYIAGRNLRDLMHAHGLLPLDQIAAIIQQIGMALDYAHAQGIVHRDVKPSNIIVDDAGHATLTDFGIVKVFEATTLQTTSGAILGTPAYASPEQVDSKPLDNRSDLYSLGVVAYELCTNKVPFAADTVPSLYYKIAHETPPAPSQVNARVAIPIEMVLLKGLSKDREARYPHGKEFASALSAAIEQVTGEQLTDLYRQAVALEKQGNLDTAESKLQEVLAIQPNHTGAHTLLNEIAEQQKAQQRYQQLVNQVEQLQAEAAGWQQTHAGLGDPDHIFKLLLPSSIQSPSAVPSATKPPATSARALWIVGVVISVGTLLIALAGINLVREAIVTPGSSVAGEIVTKYGIGNFILGLSAGILAAVVAWLIIFTLTRKTRSDHD